MIWWRIELDSSGAIRSCEQVEANAKNTNLVRFVEASTKAEACSSAKQWWERRKAAQRAARKSLKFERLERGLCLCGKPIAANRSQSRCEGCLNDFNEWRSKQRAGETTPRTAADPVRSRENIRKSNARNFKKRGGSAGVYLRRCLKQFDNLGPEKFRAWLVSEIERRSSGASENQRQTTGDGL